MVERAQTHPCERSCTTSLPPNAQLGERAQRLPQGFGSLGRGRAVPLGFMEAFVPLFTQEKTEPLHLACKQRGGERDLRRLCWRARHFRLLIVIGGTPVSPAGPT